MTSQLNAQLFRLDLNKEIQCKNSRLGFNLNPRRLKSVVRVVSVKPKESNTESSYSDNLDETEDLIIELEQHQQIQEIEKERQVEEVDLDILDIHAPGEELDIQLPEVQRKPEWPCYLCFEYGHVRPVCPLKELRKYVEIQERISKNKQIFYSAHPELRSRERKRKNQNYSQSIEKRSRCTLDVVPNHGAAFPVRGSHLEEGSRKRAFGGRNV